MRRYNFFYIHGLVFVACYILALPGCSNDSPSDSNFDAAVGDSDSVTNFDSDTNANSNTDTASEINTNIDTDSNTESDTISATDTDTDSETSLVDNDSDGWVSDFDCDDENPSVNSGMTEIYDPANGIDENCDGQTDEKPEDPDTTLSFIWIANTGEGTVSKIHTRREVEVARYITSPLGAVAEGDPSRTTVNRHGDAIVLNRRHPVRYDTSSSSSVTKFAGSKGDCVDKNNNGSIETSDGTNDVRLWEKDECMLWHTSLGKRIRAGRAAAWDGQEDPKTGVGGHVWIGTCEKLEKGGAQDYIFKLNGDTGEIMETIKFAGCAYGAAMDKDGNLWIVDRAANYAVHRLDTSTLEVETFATGAGYGIAIDGKGSIWATGNAGLNKVSRYNPNTAKADTLTLDSVYNFPRGAGAGILRSAGYVWVADNNGYLLKFDENSFTLAKAFPVGATNSPNTIGIGIDADGFVWVVSMSENAAFKFDPITETYVTISVGTSPYTYSDMTGIQLLTQLPPT